MGTSSSQKLYIHVDQQQWQLSEETHLATGEVTRTVTARAHSHG
jgi:hypothetical protein